jgi:hypothetical protein
VGVGLAVTLGWVLTYAISQASFEIVPVSTVTFTGPATDTLMALVTERSVPLSFGVGLVPGVFIGAGLPALLAGEWKIQRFGPDTPMERYFIGAVLMGFGAMLAGRMCRGVRRLGRVGDVADGLGRGRVDLGGWHGDLRADGPRCRGGRPAAV